MERQGGGIDAPQTTGLVRVQALVQKLDQVSPGGTLVLPWKLHTSFSGDSHHLLFRCEYRGRGLQKEVHTPKRGSQKVYYFIDGDQREFHSEEELLAALGKEG